MLLTGFSFAFDHCWTVHHMAYRCRTMLWKRTT